jgi:hypothetical protein
MKSDSHVLLTMSESHITDDWVLVEQDCIAESLQACTGSSATAWSTTIRVLISVVVPLVTIVLFFLLSPFELWNFWYSGRPLFVGKPDYAKMMNFLSTKLMCPLPFLNRRICHR